MTSKHTQGYVYIITNPNFRKDCIKIGKTSRDPNIRVKELYNTSIPSPFEIYATLKSIKYEIIEKSLYNIIDEITAGIRINKKREFFDLEPEKALNLLKFIAKLIDDAEIDEAYKKKK
jgi:hypothetical protein